LKALGKGRPIEKENKELVVTLLKTRLHKIERIWKKGKRTRDKGARG
jgi:hypothetical protein